MSAPALEFTALVTDRRLPRAVAEKIADAVAGMDGRRLVISIREQKRRRSLSQNAYYWAVPVRLITQAFREHGNMVDDEDVHQFLKAEVGKLRQKVVTPDGEVLDMPGSTKRLTTQEMEVYLERVRAWAAETLGLSVPLPNEIINDEQGGGE